MLLAFAAPASAVVIPPGPQILLTWADLGSGTAYSLQSTTDLTTWTTVAGTAATNVSLSLSGNPLCAFRLLAANAPPQTATLSWDSSISAGVAGYNLYYGGSSGNYTNKMSVGLTTNGVATNLLAGAKYYFAVTACTSSGLESAYSNEAVWQCPLVLNIQPSP